MAPLTRSRAVDRRVPNRLMGEYYSQRASAGMILSEATAVTPMGVGYPDTPGIWSTEQVEGWKAVTRAVHDARRADPAPALARRAHLRPHVSGRETPVAPSPIAAGGHVSLVRPNKPFVSPRALDADEIPGVVEAYAGRGERQSAPASTASRSTAPTATCSTSSSRTAPTTAPTATAARSRTGPGSCWKSPTPASQSGAPTASACTSPPAATPIRWATPTPPPRSATSPGNWAARDRLHLRPRAPRPRPPGPAAQVRLRRLLHRQREVHPGNRPAGARRRRSRRHCVRRSVHRQPGPAQALRR